MPRIKNIALDNTINDNDKLLGTDSQTGNTKNFDSKPPPNLYEFRS